VSGAGAKALSPARKRADGHDPHLDPRVIQPGSPQADMHIGYSLALETWWRHWVEDDEYPA
jgi:hypothetical protein